MYKTSNSSYLKILTFVNFFEYFVLTYLVNEYLFTFEYRFSSKTFPQQNPTSKTYAQYDTANLACVCYRRSFDEGTVTWNLTKIVLGPHFVIGMI